MKRNTSEQERFQAFLKKVRLDANLRQIDLAKLLGQPQSYVSKYESGERRLDVLELRRICKALGTTIVEFLKRFEESLT